MTPHGSRVLHRALLRAALAAGHVFTWVFIFQYFNLVRGNLSEGIAATLLTFALTQLITVLLTPFFAREIRVGFKRLLIYGTLVLSLAFALLAAGFAGYLGSAALGVTLFALLSGVYRSMYRVPYALAKESTPGRIHYLWEVFIALAPAAAGFLLIGGPVATILLLSITALLTALSIVPLLPLPDIRESYAWGYRESFHELFSSDRRRMTFDSILAGIEGAALLILWPLLIFLLLQWSYAMLGIVLSATLLLALFLRRFFERRLTHLSSAVTALINASSWIMRLSVAGAVGVVLVDTYFYLGSGHKRRGIDFQTFEQAADNATHVDEYTALKEMGMGIGRIIVCLVTAGLAAYFSVALTFTLVFITVALVAAYSSLSQRTAK